MGSLWEALLEPPMPHKGSNNKNLRGSAYYKGAPLLVLAMGVAAQNNYLFICVLPLLTELSLPSVDMGRVKELRDSGLGASAIAKEMGDSVVSTTCKRKMLNCAANSS